MLGELEEGRKETTACEVATLAHTCYICKTALATLAQCSMHTLALEKLHWLKLQNYTILEYPSLCLYLGDVTKSFGDQNVI